MVIWGKLYQNYLILIAFLLDKSYIYSFNKLTSCLSKKEVALCLSCVVWEKLTFFSITDPSALTRWYGKRRPTIAVNLRRAGIRLCHTEPHGVGKKDAFPLDDCCIVQGEWLRGTWAGFWPFNPLIRAVHCSEHPVWPSTASLSANRWLPSITVLFHRGIWEGTVWDVNSDFQLRMLSNMSTSFLQILLSSRELKCR